MHIETILIKLNSVSLNAQVPRRRYGQGQIMAEQSYLSRALAGGGLASDLKYLLYHRLPVSELRLYLDTVVVLLQLRVRRARAMEGHVQVSQRSHPGVQGRQRIEVGSLYMIQTGPGSSHMSVRSSLVPRAVRASERGRVLIVVHKAQ